MAELIPVVIDGKQIQVPYDTQLLQACRQAGSHVPTLCHNENLKPYGVCRICTVEINEGRRPRLVPACVYTIRKPATVVTDNEVIRKHRSMLLKLQLARCSQEKVVQDLAAQYGVEAPPERFRIEEKKCILCGLCVQTCRDIVGVAAIAFEGRGENRKVTTPFDAENPICIACGACAYICPTQCIGFGDKDGKRHLEKWHREVEMLVCEKCGKQWMPDAFAHVMAKKMGIDPMSLEKCPDCRG